MSGETSTPRLENAIRAVLAPRLREDGFAGSGRTFRRVIDGWVHVVNVQGNRCGGSFAINLSLHPLAVPDLRSEEPNPKKITEEICEFRRRLSSSGVDQWWQHDSSKEAMHAAMLQAADVYVDVGRPLLAQVTGMESPVHTVTPEEFARGDFKFGGFNKFEIRTALVLARLRRNEGRIADAVAFAKLGLARIEVATPLRRPLEELASLLQ